MRAISNETGISEPTIKKYLVSHFIYPTKHIKRINFMYSDGMEISEIAMLLNIKPETIMTNLPYSRAEMIGE